MQDVAVGLFCKTPVAGLSKTRLCPPLRPEQSAAMSACFIRDISATIDDLAREGGITPYAVYTPAGSEVGVRLLLPPNFLLLPQHGGDFGTRVAAALRELLARHAGVILVNADSPTLPASILRMAIAAMRPGGVVLSPAIDGGYTLIGLAQLPERLFVGIPWSTPQVHQRTVERARALGLAVTDVPGWYDVDDAESLALLQSELMGDPLPFASAAKGAAAPATRSYLATLALAQPARDSAKD